MALLIEKDCINCDMCLPECPNQAISFDAKIYRIDAAKCTECIGHYDSAQCVDVCPIDCVIPDPQHIETPTALLEKFQRLYA
jgi:ferredoxin